MKTLKGLFFGLLFVIPFWVGIYAAFGATYYVRADGTNADPDCSESSACCAGAMDMSDVVGGSFSAGDRVKFCDDGGDYTETLVSPSSGSDGSPIIFEAADGDTPIINGGTTVSAWSKTSGRTNVYEASVAASLGGGQIDDCFSSIFGTVWEGDYWMTQQSDVAGVDSNAGSCYYDDSGDKLYIHTWESGNPSTDGYTYRVSTVYDGVQSGLNQYVVFDGLTTQYICHHHFNNQTYYPSGNVGANITFQNCTASYIRHDGFVLVGENNTIVNCTCTYLTNGDTAFLLVGIAGLLEDRVTENCTIENSFVSNTGYNGSGSGKGQGRAPAACKVEQDPTDSEFKNIQISDDVLYAIQTYNDGDDPNPGTVIFNSVNVESGLSFLGAYAYINGGDDIVIKNGSSMQESTTDTIYIVDGTVTVKNNVLVGPDGAVQTEAFVNADAAGVGVVNVYGNVLIGTTSDKCAGVYLENTAGANFYNNTLYNMLMGIYCSADVGTGNLNIYNNIFHTVAYAIQLITAGDLGVTDYNDYYNVTGFVVVATPYSFADWKTGLGGCPGAGNDCSSIESDPQFVNVGTNFSLKISSPCRIPDMYLVGYESKIFPWSSSGFSTVNDILVIGAVADRHGAAGM